MLVTFRSKAAGDIHMFAENAREILTLLGKDFAPESAPRGIFTVDQLSGAVATLRSAVEADRSRQRHEESATKADEERGRAVPVGLAQRAFPLLDMLERAEKKKVDVVWGV